jgi:signal transduction histidine kinase
MHNGSIRVASTVGHGSRFVIRLPAAEHQRADEIEA